MTVFMLRLDFMNNTYNATFIATRGGPCQHGLMLCVDVGSKQWSNDRPLYA